MQCDLGRLGVRAVIGDEGPQMGTAAGPNLGDVETLTVS
jgi:hypothetical protein